MSEKIKDFDDIISFLEQPTSKIITHLKKNKNFIEKWFDEYLNELPEIHTKLVYLDISEQMQNCPTWFSDLEELIITICKECLHNKSEIVGCSNISEMAKCINNYTNILNAACKRCTLQTSKCNEVNVNKLKNISNNRLPGFQFKNSAIYSGGLIFHQYSASIIEDRKKEDKRRKEQRELRRKLQGCEDKNNIEEEIRVVEATKEKKKDHKKQNTIELMKKHRAGYPILRCDFKFDNNFSEKDLENLFTGIVNNHIVQIRSSSFRQIEDGALNVISLYYLFIWDLLNKTQLRDCPSEYDIIFKTGDYVSEGMILAHCMINGDKNGEEIEDWTNGITNPEYDPAYKQKYQYLFSPDIITTEQFIRLSDSLTKLMKIIDFTFSEKDLPKEITSKINKLVKNRRMLRSPIKNIKGNSVTIDFNEIDKETIAKYVNYKIHHNFFLLFYSLFEKNFRSKKSKYLTKRLLDAIRKGYKDGKKLIEICEDYNKKIISEDIGKKIKPVVYTTISGEINKKIIFHPDWEKKHRGKRNISKDIIRKSSPGDHLEWIKEIT